MKFLLLVVFTLFINYTFAQPKVVTFGGESEDRKFSFVESNNLKFSILEFVSSDYSFYYERKVHNKLSFEVGAGATYGDFIGNFFTPTPEISDNIGLDKRLGYSFSGALRFYFSEVFDGFYAAPVFKYRLFNWENDISIPSEDNFKPDQYITVAESRAHTIARMNFGFFTTTYNNFSWDFHFGIGVNKRTENVYTYEANQVKNINLPIIPRVSIGIKVGYLF
jgi:hypothetical protein